MKLNNFFFPSSYSEEKASETIISLRGLNEACNMRTPFDDFYNDDSFYNVIVNIPSLYTLDKELIYRIVPQTLKMMKSCGKINDNLDEINKKETADINSLWGYFNMSDIYHNSNIDEYRLHRNQLINNHVSGNVFQEWLPLLFSKIKFTDSALTQIVDLGEGVIFSKILEGLRYLDKYNSSWNDGSFQLSALSEISRFEVSDESDRVKDNSHLKHERYFILPDNIGGQYCFYHMKIKSENRNWRIHFYPCNDKCCIYIAYVGCHLRLR